MFSGATPFLTRLAILWVMAVVLPLPGIAITDAVPNMKSAACCCCLFSFSMVFTSQVYPRLFPASLFLYTPGKWNA
jgi:hypothetical protein